MSKTLFVDGIGANAAEHEDRRKIAAGRGTASNLIHTPTSGRLSTSSMRLADPHARDQAPEQFGALGHHLRAGARYLGSSARPIISAMVGFEGMPSVSIGMNEVCAASIVGGYSGAATPRMSPSPNARGGLGDLLLGHVGRERGEQRAAAW